MTTPRSLFSPLTLLPLFVVACLTTAPAAAATLQIDAAMEKQIEAAARRMIDEKLTPGLAVGIISEGKIVYARGFGLANLETGTEVTADSVFVIGSNTKQFTATAIMLLVEQRKLALDDRLSKFFPDFPRSHEVTLRHLLTHSSGIHPVMIPGGLPTPEQRVRLRSAADLVPIIAGQTSLYDFDPGKGRRYSNSGYILLGGHPGAGEEVAVEEFGERESRDFFDDHARPSRGRPALSEEKRQGQGSCGQRRECAKSRP